MDQETFFQEASEDLRQLFNKGFTALSLKAGETLFEQDDYDDRLYVLDQGLLEVSVYSSSGRKLSLNQMGAESVFGEIAIFDPGPRTARVEAIEDSKLRAIRQSVVVAAIVDAPHLATEMLSLAGKRMRWMSRQMEDQVFLTPSSRLAAKVLYLGGADGKIEMSQAKLADYVGVTRELVSKILAEWRREGFVALSRGRIDVLDGKALQDIRNSELI